MQQSTNVKSVLCEADYELLKGIVYPVFCRRVDAVRKQARGCDSIDMLQGRMEELREAWGALDRMFHMLQY